MVRIALRRPTARSRSSPQDAGARSAFGFKRRELSRQAPRTASPRREAVSRLNDLMQSKDPSTEFLDPNVPGKGHSERQDEPERPAAAFCTGASRAASSSLSFAHTAVISLRSCRFGPHGVAVDVRTDELFCTPVDRQLTARPQLRTAIQLEERAAGGATHHAQENDDERF